MGQCHGAQSKIVSSSDVNRGNTVDRIYRRQEERKETADEDEKDRGSITYAEPQNRDWNPGQRRNGAEDPEPAGKAAISTPCDVNRMKSPSGTAKPAAVVKPQVTRKREATTYFNRSPVPRQVGNTTNHFASGVVQKMNGPRIDGDLPNSEQNDNKRERPKPDK